jgi:hypothetical protein
VIDQPEDVVMLFNSHAGELWRALLVVAGGRDDLAEEATAHADRRGRESASGAGHPRWWRGQG